jgi:predicted enzyme related to lactoylglutathione lyase
MPERSNYPDGAPCWADVLSHDPKAAAKFYKGVFGWKLRDTGADFGHYMIASVGEQQVAAITPPPPDGGDQMPPAWTVYLKATNAKTTAKKVEANGGKVIMPPMQVPGQGHMLLAADPTGAVFGVWQPTDMTGSALWGENGAMCWAEVNTRDGAAADAFYTKVFPLKGQPQEGMDYTVYTAKKEMVAGRFGMGDDMPGVPPNWLPYFQVADADKTVAKVTKLGGKVMMPAKDSEYGRFAVVSDPEGASFAVLQPPKA